MEKAQWHHPAPRLGSGVPGCSSLFCSTHLCEGDTQEQRKSNSEAVLRPGLPGGWEERQEGAVLPPHCHLSPSPSPDPGHCLTLPWDRGPPPQAWSSSLALPPVSSAPTSPLLSLNCCVLGSPLHVPRQTQQSVSQKPRICKTGVCVCPPRMLWAPPRSWRPNVPAGSVPST